jgi:hypothetical protein
VEVQRRRNGCGQMGKLKARPQGKFLGGGWLFARDRGVKCARVDTPNMGL